MANEFNLIIMFRSFGLGLGLGFRVRVRVRVRVFLLPKTFKLFSF